MRIWRRFAPWLDTADHPSLRLFQGNAIQTSSKLWPEKHRILPLGDGPRRALRGHEQNFLVHLCYWGSIAGICIATRPYWKVTREQQQASTLNRILVWLSSSERGNWTNYWTQKMLSE